MSNIILYHYTKDPFVFDSTRVYDNKMDLTPIKPKGIWLSDCNSNLGWREWCEEQDFMIESLKHRTKFKVDTSNWAVLSSPKMIRDFYDEFKMGGALSEYLHYVNWGRVKEKHGALFITPYCWHSRSKMFWYYGWDCASACVWDLSTIKVVP